MKKLKILTIFAAIGTGGTISGISKFAEEHQKSDRFFKAVKDESLEKRF